MSGSLVADLGLGPEVWLFLTLLSILTLFFKFSRFWSLRNLDLILLFAPAPGLMHLVGSGLAQPWWPFVWLFLGLGLWLLRCLLDLGLTRRPQLEPNLNAAGLTCVAVGIMGLMISETIQLPVEEGAARNPADPVPNAAVGRRGLEEPVRKVIDQAPLPASLKRNPPQVVVSRVLACLAHLGLVAALIGIGVKHFERPIAGLSMAACYLLSPFTRIAIVDSGQLVPSALIVTAVLVYRKPLATGALIGLAGGWMPASLGLIPLWAGFYGRRGGLRFLLAAVGVAGACALLGLVPWVADWATGLGARSLAQAGLVPGVEAPRYGSFWSRIDPAYRLPVLIGYLALVLATTFWPARKNLGELIALSAALLVASQFWYLDEGGTLILLYLPLFLLMIFRPNFAARRHQRADEKSSVPKPIGASSSFTG